MVHGLWFGSEIWFKSEDRERVADFGNGTSEALMIQ